VYGFGLFWSIVPYWYFITITLTASMLPSLFQPEVAKAWNFWRLGRLTNPFLLHTPLPSIAEGELWFIQWDFFLIATTCFVWALTLRLQLVTARRAYHVKQLRTIIAGFAYALVIGPVGTAVLMMWQRDTLLLKTANHRKDIQNSSSKESFGVLKSGNGDVALKLGLRRDSIVGAT